MGLRFKRKWSGSIDLELFSFLILDTLQEGLMKIRGQIVCCVENSL